MTGPSDGVGSAEETLRKFLRTFFLIDAVLRFIAGLALVTPLPRAGWLCLAGALISLLLFLVAGRADVSRLVVALGFTWSLFFVGHMWLFGWQAGFQQQTAFLVFVVFLFEHLPLRARLIMALAPLPGIVIIKVALSVWDPVYALPVSVLDIVSLGNLLYAIVTGSSVLLYFAITADRRQRQLAAELERRKRMIADLSHEIKTPLAAMLARTQLELLTGEQSNERRVKTFSIIERNLQGMRRLARLMLDLTRFDARGMVAKMVVVDAGEIARESIDLVQPLAAKKNLRMELEMPARESVTGDPELLGMVLNNLLSNAIRHSPEGGRIIIRLSRETGEPAAPQGFFLAVEDEGPGIPEQILPHIFEPFYRGDEGRSRTERANHGLGLSIARRAVEQMGGRISAESVLGEGSRFLVRL